MSIINLRAVAQLGSVPPWGGGGRQFKSDRPDQKAGAFLPFRKTSVFSVT